MDPGADRLLDLAVQALHAGRLADAERALDDLLARSPDNAAALFVRGVVHAHRGEFPAAVARVGEAARLAPDSAHYRSTLGQLCLDAGDPAGAVAAFRQALSLAPADAALRRMLGVALLAAGSDEQAIAELRAALAIDPNASEAQTDLLGALSRQGSDDLVVDLYQLLQLRRGRPPRAADAGQVLGVQGRFDEAIAHYRRRLNAAPGDGEAEFELGLLDQAQGRIDDALRHYHAAAGALPAQPEFHYRLGFALDTLGEAAEAAACYRRALDLQPDHLRASDDLLSVLLYASGVPRAEHEREYRRYNRVFVEPLRARRRAHGNSREPERRLRLGYVSSDFRQHAVNNFFEPVLRCHERGAFEVFCYDNFDLPDAVTRRLMTYDCRWRPIARLRDEQAAEMMRTDGIDILVDLGGHTPHNRLPLFGLKPAPVQATWLGYPSTTGVETVDYWVSDRSIAAGLSGQYHSERIAALPRFFMCFQPNDLGMQPQPAPAAARGYVTFGSFNAFPKVSAAAFGAWVRVLQAVPASRMVVAQVPRGAAQERVRERFRQAGIDPARIDIHPRVGDRRFLELHGEVDIVLDTFPYAGTTTTAYGTWMGVPTVTLAGDTHASRVGASFMASLGFEALVAAGEDEYLELAVRWARDTDRLHRMRVELRERLRASPIMDAQGFTRDLEAEYRRMWAAWCAG